MTAGLDQFQVAAPDQYAGASPQWKRRLLAAQLLQQQAQTGDKVYGAGLGSMKLLASALGGWMEGKEEAKVLAAGKSIADTAPSNQPDEPTSSSTPAASISPAAPRPAVSAGGGKAVTNYDPKNPPDFLDLVGGAEGTDKGRGYNETLAYGKFAGGPQDLENMPVSQVRQLQAQMLQHPQNTFNSSAAGRGQIVGKTLQGLIDQGVVKPDELYNKDVQDRAIDHLAQRRGADAAGLRNEWEGLRRVPDDVIVAAYNKRYGAKQPTQTAGELPTDVSSADPNFVPSMQGNKIKPDIAGAMAPMMPPKAAPVPGPSTAPPDLTSIAIDSATGKPIPANAARLDTSAIDRAHPRSQTAPQPAAEAPPAPQQMAQAQTQPQASGRPQAVTQTAQDPARAARDRAWANMVLQQHGAGIPGAAPYVDQAKAILNPAVHKLNDDTMYTVGPGGQIKYINAPENPGHPLVTPEERGRWGIQKDDTKPYYVDKGRLQTPGGQNITVNADKTGAQGMMTKGVEGFDTAHTAAVSASRRIASYGQLAKAMEGFTPGASAEIRMNAKRWLKDAGLIGDEGVSDAETFDRIAKNLQITAQPKGQGQVSNFERELFSKAVVNMGNSPEAIAKAVGIAKRLDEYDLKVAQLYRDNARKNNGLPNYLEVMEDVAKMGSPMTQAEVNSLQGLLDRGGKQAPATAAPTGVPQPGEVRKGYRFKGGDPSDKGSWEPAAREKVAL